ncbi:MAG: hypothetical protein H6855_04960 [Rhodospirillales bacterium]|nr:hypothetical protein [Rhodospirillales bacterium]MCB9965413.1 hypothetical protein [Rhodospirillales bacterium]MCB9973309.1 hypothetical protein [Rhodospirillales bacterium]MCB9973957.1 hypothetical protein [Rhodospirillales bacterium]MCB9979882.1 hypothetical protein [Rhodospirillales bacterium]
MSVEKRVSYFNFVRDIPYKIGLEGHQDYGCASKSGILTSLLEGLGLKTRQIICRFDWEETPLPRNVLGLPRQKDDVTHMFIQVFIPETGIWVNCDPTWDTGLKQAGFEIAEWDGLSDTIIGVNPIEIFSPEGSDLYMEKWSNPDLVASHMAYHHAFYAALNEWMETCR